MTIEPSSKSQVVRVSLRPTHGTATRIELKSVLPLDKQEREVFWVQKLISAIEVFSDAVMAIRTNPDDSHGGHDVIVQLASGASVGVQVTELTYEIQRRRRNVQERYIERVIDAIKIEGVASSTPIIVKLLVTVAPTDKIEFSPKALARLIGQNLDGVVASTIIPIGIGKVQIDPISGGEFYVPNANKIGVDANFDQVPFTFENYARTIDYLATKKAGSISPWLLIWSTDFWRDKHWLGEQILAYMAEAFASSQFERVYFAESLDGVGPFDVNLTIHKMKR